jgi:hypothetical protein
MATSNYANYAQKYDCKYCDFSSCKKNDYERHVLTQKHKINTLATFSNTLATEKTHTCEFCNKKYKDRTGLWRHKKKCINTNINTNNNTDNNTNNTNNNTNSANENELVQFLMKENSEFKQLLIEQNNQLVDLSNKIGNNIFNNVNCNNNNKTFNLQVFLNETCKNAMNISEFADSIQLQLSDLESVGELGYVNGISNIIIKNLKELDITQRPIHCTDVKRETLYIKDHDKWEKEGDQKDIIVKFVNNIANKNIRTLSEFKKKYPDCCKYESKYSDYYSKLIIEAMGGPGGTNAEKNEKIIKKITKEVIIDKTLL